MFPLLDSNKRTKNALACDYSFQSLDLSFPLSIARFTTSNQHCLYATHDVQYVNAVSHSLASPTVHSHIQTEQDSKWRGAFLFFFYLSLFKTRESFPKSTERNVMTWDSLGSLQAENCNFPVLRIFPVMSRSLEMAWDPKEAIKTWWRPAILQLSLFPKDA